MSCFGSVSSFFLRWVMWLVKKLTWNWKCCVQNWFDMTQRQPSVSACEVSLWQDSETHSWRLVFRKDTHRYLLFYWNLFSALSFLLATMFFFSRKGQATTSTRHNRLDYFRCSPKSHNGLSLCIKNNAEIWHIEQSGDHFSPCFTFKIYFT